MRFWTLSGRSWVFYPRRPIIMGQSPYSRSTSSTSFFDFIYWAVLERREEERRDEAWRRKWREEILAEWHENGWRTERYTEEKLTEELEEERKKRATKDRAEKEATWRRNGWWFDENFPHREGGGRGRWRRWPEARSSK